MALGQMPADKVAEILSRYDLSGDSLTPDCNVTLIRDGERTILIDVGAGPEFMASAGKLQDALAAIDVAPETVTHVIFTHAHPDHLWGLLDDFEDPVFPNATYLIGKAEWDYWMDPDTVNTIDAGRTTFAVGAKRRLELLEDNITFFNDGEEILPSIAARATFGHTPGHMAIQIGGFQGPTKTATWVPRHALCCLTNLRPNRCILSASTCPTPVSVAPKSAAMVTSLWGIHDAAHTFNSIGFGAAGRCK